MNHKQVPLLIIAVFLGMSFLVGCGESAPATESETPAATSVPEQATSTATPDQVAPTPTMVRHPRKDVERPAITITLPEGDPERGHSIGTGKYRCSRCHIDADRYPLFRADGELPAILARAEMRIADPAYSGSATTAEEYLIESIIDPRLYEIDGDWEQSMYDDYYDIPEQDLADLIAWVLTFED